MNVDVDTDSESELDMETYTDTWHGHRDGHGHRYNVHVYVKVHNFVHDHIQVLVHFIVHCPFLFPINVHFHTVFMCEILPCLFQRTIYGYRHGNGTGHEMRHGLGHSTNF